MSDYDTMKNIIDFFCSFTVENVTSDARYSFLLEYMHISLYEQEYCTDEDLSVEVEENAQELLSREQTQSYISEQTRYFCIDFVRKCILGVKQEHYNCTVLTRKSQYMSEDLTIAVTDKILSRFFTNLNGFLYYLYFDTCKHTACTFDILEVDTCSYAHKSLTFAQNTSLLSDIKNSIEQVLMTYAAFMPETNTHDAKYMSDYQKFPAKVLFDPYTSGLDFMPEAEPEYVNEAYKHLDFYTKRQFTQGLELKKENIVNKHITNHNFDSQMKKSIMNLTQLFYDEIISTPYWDTAIQIKEELSLQTDSLVYKGITLTAIPNFPIHSVVVVKVQQGSWNFFL